MAFIILRGRTRLRSGGLRERRRTEEGGQGKRKDTRKPHRKIRLGKGQHRTCLKWTAFITDRHLQMENGAAGVRTPAPEPPAPFRSTARAATLLEGHASDGFSLSLRDVSIQSSAWRVGNRRSSQEAVEPRRPRGCASRMTPAA